MKEGGGVASEFICLTSTDCTGTLKLDLESKNHKAKNKSGIGLEAVNTANRSAELR